MHQTEQGFPVDLPPVIVPERVHAARIVLLWQARGSSTCVIDGERRPLLAGQALWIPCGVVHELHVAADSVVLPVHLDAACQPIGVLDRPTWVSVDTDLRTVILAALQQRVSIIRSDAEIERRLIAMVRHRVVTPSALRMPQTDFAYTIAESLRDVPGGDRSIAELAADEHVSPRTLERVFIAETGMTPQAWRGQRRMEVAAALLRRSAPLASVCSSVGYQSTSAFRRAFKRHHGITPSEYAARHAIGS